jgi:hypothetical protein
MTDPLYPIIRSLGGDYTLSSSPERLATTAVFMNVLADTSGDGQVRDPAHLRDSCAGSRTVGSSGVEGAVREPPSTHRHTGAV